MIKGIHHIAIICSDYEQSKYFYTEILGFVVLQEVFRKERASFKLDLALNNEYMIELFSFPNTPKRISRPEATGLRHIAFKVEQINQYHSYLNSKNVTCEEIRVDEYTQKKFFFAFDPDELPIEFYEL